LAKLSEMPNIGKVMEKRLAAVDVQSPQDLIRVGSKEAFARLWSLEGDT